MASHRRHIDRHPRTRIDLVARSDPGRRAADGCLRVHVPERVVRLPCRANEKPIAGAASRHALCRFGAFEPGVVHAG